MIQFNMFASLPKTHIVTPGDASPGRTAVVVLQRPLKNLALLLRAIVLVLVRVSGHCYETYSSSAFSTRKPPASTLLLSPNESIERMIILEADENSSVYGRAHSRCTLASPNHPERLRSVTRSQWTAIGNGLFNDVGMEVRQTHTLMLTILSAVPWLQYRVAIPSSCAATLNGGR